MSEPEGGVSGGFVFVESDAHRNDPLELYSLFRGEPDLPQGRYLAMSGVRRPGDVLSAKPFRKHGVDYRLLPDGGGITESIGVDGVIISFEQEVAGEPLLVYGFVADHIVAVDIRAAGKTSGARLENNAYAALAEAEPDELEGLVFRRSDGTTYAV
jgi:hypothetical protein